MPAAGDFFVISLRYKENPPYKMSTAGEHFSVSGRY